MEYKRIEEADFSQLKHLQRAYKKEIGEDCPTEQQFLALWQAIEQGKIHFYGCFAENKLLATCSISCNFSTFDYGLSGIFEDFYILPEYRHKGIARKLVQFAYQESGVSSLLVGCADCDLEMYQALGFGIRLGNMLAFG